MEDYIEDDSQVQSSRVATPTNSNPIEAAHPIDNLSAQQQLNFDEIPIQYNVDINERRIDRGFEKQSPIVESSGITEID